MATVEAPPDGQRTPPSGAPGVPIKQDGRVQGSYQPPDQTMIKTVTVKVSEGAQNSARRANRQNS